MGFKDDFVEALRSVKKDFFKDHDYSEQEKQAKPSGEENMKRQEQAPPPKPHSTSEPVSGASKESPERTNGFETHRQANHTGSGDLPPDNNSEIVPAVREDYNYTGEKSDRRSFVDYGESGVYDGEQTIISRNTVLRGALQTEDSVRLLGQMMGDIDCKANVVVAGKVRGNTTAANAYVYDAQIDGDLRCDDAITVSSDAWILGNIRAQQAEIDGKIKGNMEIRHMISIGASSSILGDISTDELEIKRGAFVNGQIMMYSPARDVLDRFDRFED